MDRTTLLERARQCVANFALNESKDRCIICNSLLEVQDHHIYPKSLGGPEDGPTVSICSRDHLRIHHLVNKNKPDISDIDVEKQKIVKLLVRFIILAKIVYEELDPTLIDRKVQIVLPHALLQRSHKRKKDLGYSNLNDYILYLITMDTTKL